METTKHIWFNGELVPWEDAKVHVLCHSLHYGSAVFEGIRFYKTEQGPAIFRLPEHVERFFYSTRAIGMTLPYEKQALFDAIVKTVKANELPQGYIRPLAFYGYGSIGLKPGNSPVEVMIACWPWGAYLPFDMVDLKISQYIRIHPKSTVADAKISGHYVNSIMAGLELKGTNYHEALLLDFEGNIAEGPGENLFIVKKGVLYTPKFGTILPGITRDTIMQVAKQKGITCKEAVLKPEDVFSADEAFYTGTAAEVTPIRSVDDNIIADGTLGPITNTIKETYHAIVHGQEPTYRDWLTYT